jgi:hypothetical protein
VRFCLVRGAVQRPDRSIFGVGNVCFWLVRCAVQRPDRSILGVYKLRPTALACVLGMRECVYGRYLQVSFHGAGMRFADSADPAKRELRLKTGLTRLVACCLLVACLLLVVERCFGVVRDAHFMRSTVVCSILAAISSRRIKEIELGGGGG